MITLKCPQCGWLQPLTVEQEIFWLDQEWLMLTYPDNWRSKVHPMTCLHCSHEMEEV